ncbi:MAG: hypothetical protein JWQ89_395, partial [Devosia sp.]|uniref:TauD/TfdA family dioxygenase n=1 Tax=Devosia sp. TaxID=1871048 RepID=UPI00263778F7
MSDFRTFPTAERQPAVPMQPVIDPAGWDAASLGPVENWSYQITPTDQDELVAGVAAFRKTGRPIVEVDSGNFPLAKLAGTLRDIRRELLDGRGLVMIQNFPLDQLDPEGVAIAYMGFGSYLGDKMLQNKHGHVLGHVKDLGEDYSTTGRAYNTNAELRFHSDACNYVGLLCLQTAKSGGESRVASSVTVYNEILQRRPDLAKVLTEDFYRSYAGEMNPGELPYHKQPIFTFADGYFSAIGAGITIEKALKLPGVPPLTSTQAEAIQLYRSIVSDLAADIPFKRGDIQFLSNYVTLHSRRHYEDWPQ